ncbi:MAG: AAA family ATPase [Hydrogenophilus sp.]|nr:AAA family ATPase [Hydrogenophilus sp.]
MKVVAVATPKGGCGKTTLAIHLADWLARGGEEVVLWDLDPQQSACEWWAGGRFAFECRGGEWEEIERERERKREGWAVVDCPPGFDARGIERVGKIARVVLVPVLPSPLDLWACARWVGELAQAAHKEQERWLVVNQFERQSATVLPAVLAAARELGVQVAAGVVTRRAIYRRAALEGRSAFGYGRIGRAAQEELERLFGEVVRG